MYYPNPSSSCKSLGGKKANIIVIAIFHGKKMFETLLVKEDTSKVVDMGAIHSLPAASMISITTRSSKKGIQRESSSMSFILMKLDVSTLKKPRLRVRAIR